MARRTRTFLITAVAAVAALIPAAGASAGTLDQQQTISNFGGLQVDSNNSKAQTFTAGLTGLLDQVDLALSGMGVTTPLTVQIRDGSATTPGDTVLASASVPTSAVTSSESFVPITFTSPASVTAGTQYSIVALNESAPVSGWFWYAGKTPDGSLESAYEGGKLYSVMNGTGTGPWSEGNSLADFEFKTYVVPPPDTRIDSGPVGKVSTPDVTFTYSGIPPGGVDHFECKLDGGSFAPCPDTGKTYAGLVDGQHVFAVVATDVGDNADPTPPTRSFSVDATAPQTLIRKAAKKPRKRKLTITFASSESGSSFKCKLDRRAFAPCTSPKTYRRLKAGRHKVKIQATDALGNVDATPALVKIRIPRRRGPA